MNNHSSPQVQQVTCRKCGKVHGSPVCCPICKSIAPAYAVFKGSRVAEGAR